MSVVFLPHFPVDLPSQVTRNPPGVLKLQIPCSDVHSPLAAILPTKEVWNGIISVIEVSIGNLDKIPWFLQSLLSFGNTYYSG